MGTGDVRTSRLIGRRLHSEGEQNRLQADNEMHDGNSSFDFYLRKTGSEKDENSSLRMDRGIARGSVVGTQLRALLREKISRESM